MKLSCPLAAGRRTERRRLWSHMVSGLRPWQDCQTKSGPENQRETEVAIFHHVGDRNHKICRALDPRPFLGGFSSSFIGSTRVNPAKVRLCHLSFMWQAWLPLPFLHLFFSSWRQNANEVTRQRVIEMNSKPTLNFRMERQETTFNRMTNHSNNNSSNRDPCGKVFLFACSSFGWFRICFVADSKAQIPRTQCHRRIFLRRVKR